MNQPLENPANISLDEILNNAQKEIGLAKNISEVEQIRINYLGKSGIVTSQMKVLGSLGAEEKKAFGAKINEIKEKVSELISEKKISIEKLILEEKLNKEFIDISLEPISENAGSVHPVSQVIEEIIEIFAAMGFIVAEGPEIEDDYRNFTALNIPENHPARQMHDTFYINKTSGNKSLNNDTKYVLRTHTSPVQIRTMQNSKPPIKIIAPGRTFRCDSDQTHSPMFHQVEVLYIDKNVNMSMLKGCLQEFLDSFFGVKNLKMRFRASFFPFTEPSAEVDIGCSRKNGVIKIGQGEDWLEVLGCGMVHPNVLKNVGIDSNEYQGFAFGMGIERLAMLKYGISDLRQFFESDLRFLKHYSFSNFDIPKLSYGW
jgi:phenylalanyl-tRNA synthetase alpha chain